MTGAARSAALLLVMLAAGCTTARGPVDEPSLRVAHQNLMLRGWLGAEHARLGAVLATSAAPTVNPPGEGPYRVRGFGDDGALLFEVRFDDTGLATLPGGTERHFSLVVAAGADGALRLARVELDSVERPLAQRSARLDAAEFIELVERAHGLDLHRAGEGVVLRWDPGLYALVQLRDLETGRVLAFGRDGEIHASVASARLEVTVSDGVRSAALLMTPR